MQGMLEIKCFTFGPFGTNTYVVTERADTASSRGQVLLIDPACSDTCEQRQLEEYIDACSAADGEMNVMIVATHGHLDHLWGAAWAAQRYGVPVLIHPADIPMAEHMQAQYDLWGIRAQAQPFPIEPLPSNCQLSTLNTQLSILPTPGHTPGGVCLYFEEENVLFSGDTLFRMGYGRTDLPGGDYRQLVQSLQQLYTLPPQTQVFCGHGEPTTIAAERLRVY